MAKITGMRYFFGAGLLALATATAGAQDKANSLSPSESKRGWMLLFDGRTLNGWEARSTSSPATNGDWAVKDGAMVCPGTSAGWLATKEAFSDFRLKLEFRGNAKVNSGVFLRSQKDGQPHITGYELQIWDYQPAGYNTGSLVGTVKAPATKILADQWNSYEITTQGDHFQIVLNGKMLLDAHDGKHASGVIGF